MTILRPFAACVLLMVLAGCSSAETNPPDPPAAASCDAAAADGISIPDADVYGGPPYALGYPPYAVEGCRLVYVAEAGAGAQAGALLLRDLATGTESLLAPGAEQPRRPSLAGSVIAWEATEGGKRVVRALWYGKPLTVTGPFDHAGEPRAGLAEVVFTGWSTADDTGDTDIYVYTLGEPEAVAIMPGPGQQRFADISVTHIAFSDFSEDPDGRFDQNGTDLADIVVYDRETKTASTRALEGKQAFPMLGAAGKIAYLAWDPLHPEPKFSAYDLLVGDLLAPVENDAPAGHIETLTPYIRPVAHGSLVEWVVWPDASGASLWRRPADLSAPAAEVPGLAGLELFGPSATDKLTVLAARNPGGTMALKALAR